ncbi:TniQ family protein [Sphingomonas canadensis]|nr:TniQ family protein [Sphingomonas canadensis]MCW3834801.1 TniQ family protein [Sphingomonas canadensis]
MAECVNLLAASDIRPLVVGTEPFPGECLSSLLVRACDANRFSKPMHLLNLIGLKAQASEAVPFTQGAAVPAIAKLLGTSTTEIERRMHSAEQDDLGRSVVHWFGSHVERRHIEATARRFAPKSLEEQGHVPALWTVRLLDYCPTTMELLLSECPQCSRPLGWRACRSLSKCEKCGASLLGAESQVLPPHLHEAARLGAALVSPVEAVRQSASSSLPDPFNTWAPADALLGLLTIGEAQISLESSPGAGGAIGSAACIAAGLEFANDWPDSLTRFVKVSTSKSKTPSARRGLGTLGRLFESAATKTPIQGLVRSAISVALADAIVPAKLFPGAIVDGACRTGMLSALEATKRLGICGKRLRRLEGRSETFLARHNVKGGAALYDEAAISRLADVLELSVRSNDCARQLGIPRFCIEAFISAGLIQVATNADAAIVTDSTLITKASISALRERLQERSAPFDGGETLREAMQRNGNPYDWIAVFEKMLCGQMQLRFADCPGSSVADGLIVQASDVARHRSRRLVGKEINGIDVPCQIAAEIVGTTPQFISAAVRAGFINGALGVQCSTLPLTGVLKFQSCFVLPGELRDRIGGQSLGIGVKLRDAGYEPAAIINRVRVWRRSDIERYLKKRSRRQPN